LGRKGPTRHLKRQQAPMFWTIRRKENVWSINTSPGPHNFSHSIPVTVLLRDMLGYASTRREASMIAKQGKIRIDGKLRLDDKFPIGLMDVISLPDAGESYRILPTKGGRLALHQIKGEETSFKLCRIIGKTTLRNNITQLRLHDGRTLNVPTESTYKVNDVLKIKVPSQEIAEHISFKDQLQIIITGGRSQGETGIIIGFGDEPGWKKTATVRTSKGEDIRTLTKYVFPIGTTQSLISLPESQ
jgi:small subunit ribosomal protein S4e